MRAFLVVLLLFGAFMSVASLHKVFSVELTQPASLSVALTAFPLDPIATTSANDEKVAPLFSFQANMQPTAIQSSAVVITPEPDFCLEVPVLMYHHTQPMAMATLLGHPQLTIDSNLFDEHMRFFVENNYHFISAEELVKALLNRQPLPEKTIVITVDDGYDDNYTYAFSTAKKYNIIINFMIPTELVGKPGYMTWEHLKEMSINPYARIYNHTATHAALGSSSAEHIQQELTSSTIALKEKLGLINTVFTYPYGSFSDFAIEKVKEHGFIGAFSTIDGKTQCKSQIMTLPRTRMGNAPLSFFGF